MQLKLMSDEMIVMTIQYIGDVGLSNKKQIIIK